MNPVSPVMKGSEPIERVYGADQPEYVPLPAVYLDVRSRPVITRWRMDEEERAKVAEGADVVLTILTWGHALQPSHLQITMQDEDPILVEA